MSSKKDGKGTGVWRKVFPAGDASDSKERERDEVLHFDTPLSNGWDWNPDFVTSTAFFSLGGALAT